MAGGGHGCGCGHGWWHVRPPAAATFSVSLWRIRVFKNPL